MRRLGKAEIPVKITERRRAWDYGPKEKNKWEAFKVKEVKEEFEWDKTGFFEGITPKTRILEIGAGTGRLAQKILKTKARPENITLVDLAYTKNKIPSMKSNVYYLARKGRLKIFHGNLFKPEFDKGKKFDKIIISHAFFPGREPGINRVRHGHSDIPYLDNKVEGLRRVVELYYPFLSKGGEMYFSPLFTLMGAESAKELVFKMRSMTKPLEKSGKIECRIIPSRENRLLSAGFYMKRLK